ncbi:MAG TPA: type 4a pilus biogenesis protein PilO [Opitutaceae bacterium]|nr:type 4a pilus biogenesis protein PilO [Opitutaceae bacterium]
MNLADLMQWIAVLRRHPLSVFCAVVCVACAIVSWYIIGNLKWLDLEHRQLGQDADLAVSTLISGPAIRQELAAAREITRRIEDNLVVPDNLAENLWYFYKIEQHSKAHLLELHPLNAITSDSKALYRRIPFSIKVTGTYEQTGAFLYLTETGPRLANITSMTMRRRDTGGLVTVLDMNVELLGKK